MKLNDNIYNILKWVVMIVLPALATLYATLSGAWGLPMAEEVAVTINAFTAFLGVVLGISTVSYNKSK